MAFYIKVRPAVSDRMKLTEIRNRTADGNVLLWQADLTDIEGDTIFERAAAIGGVCLTPQDARKEIDGDLQTALPETETKEEETV